MVLSDFDQFLITGSRDLSLNIFSIDSENCGDSVITRLKDAHDSIIVCAEIIFGNKYLFSGDCNGVLKQWCVNQKCLLKDYGNICNESICCIKNIRKYGILVVRFEDNT